MDSTNKSVSGTFREPSTLDSKIVFGAQVSIIFIVIVFSLVNLTLNELSGDSEKLWVGLLGSCIGYILPNPSLKNRLKLL